MTNKSPVSVVCDAGPIIHLDELGSVSLLNDFCSVMVPIQVYEEVIVHRPNVWNQAEFHYKKVDIEIASTPSFQAIVRTFSLDLGEQGALSLMKTFSEAILLTDDAAARLAATTLGLKVHGTIGVLLRAVRRKQRSRSEVLEILQKLPSQSTLHIKDSLLQEITSQLEHSVG